MIRRYMAQCLVVPPSRWDGDGIYTYTILYVYVYG